MSLMPFSYIQENVRPGNLNAMFIPTMYVTKEFCLAGYKVHKETECYYMSLLTGIDLSKATGTAV